MDNNIRFSIIIPVFNNSLYLEECVNSILNQTYDNKIEIIIIDDGSYDGSSQICDDIAQKNKDIKIIHQKNMGQLFTRSKGMNVAQGEYVIYVDSDDKLDLNALYEINEIIDKKNYDMILYKWCTIDEKGKKLKQARSLFKRGEIDKESVQKIIVTSSELNSMCIKAIKNNKEVKNIKYDDSVYNVRNGEDLIQTLYILECCNSFYYMDKDIYLYRKNENSITNTYKDNQYKTLDVRLFVKKYLQKNNIYELYKDEYKSKYLDNIFSELTLLLNSNLDNKKEVFNVIRDDYLSFLSLKEVVASNVMTDKKIIIIMIKFNLNFLAKKIIIFRYYIIRKFIDK